MSLTEEQKSRTRRELLAHRQLCPLPDDALCHALGWTPRRLADILALTPASDPGDVWLLRDFLVQAVRDLGGVPQPFTVLTDEARAQSERWFGPRTVPPTPGQP